MIKRNGITTTALQILRTGLSRNLTSRRFRSRHACTQQQQPNQCNLLHTVLQKGYLRDTTNCICRPTELNRVLLCFKQMCASQLHQSGEYYSANGRNRTADALIFSQALYPLSYIGIGLTTNSGQDQNSLYHLDNIQQY